MITELKRDLLCASKSAVLLPGDVARLLFNRVGVQALVAYRLGRWVVEQECRPPSTPRARALECLARSSHRLLDGFVRATLDIELDPSADIGPGLQVYHFGGIRVRGCKIGADCVIHQEVRLEPDASGKGPFLGDRVWIGPHARVVGPVRVGDGATLAAGAVVTEDVPESSVVVGNPGRVVRVGYDNSELRRRD